MQYRLPVFDANNIKVRTSAVIDVEQGHRLLPAGRRRLVGGFNLVRAVAQRGGKVNAVRHVLDAVRVAANGRALVLSQHGGGSVRIEVEPVEDDTIAEAATLPARVWVPEPLVARRLVPKVDAQQRRPIRDEAVEVARLISDVTAKPIFVVAFEQVDGRARLQMPRPLVQLVFVVVDVLDEKVAPRRVFGIGADLKGIDGIA